MAASVTFDTKSKGQFFSGAEKVRRGTITLGSSYATNGVAITPAMFALKAINHLDIAPSGGLIFEWDKTNAKVKAFYPTGGSTAPAALAAPIVKSGASTASAVDATTPNIVAGQAKEVANATDLSSISSRFEVRGV